MDRRTRSVLGVARDVLSGLDLDAVLGRVLAAARDLTGAQYAAVGVLDDSRTELSRFLHLGVDDDVRRSIGPLPTGRGVLGELIAVPQPLRLADVGTHPRSYGFPPGHPAMTTFLGVPIAVGGEAYGNLYLCEKDGGEEFDQDDEDALVMLAQFAGVAIEHARRFAVSESRRVELERAVTTLDATLQIAEALGGQTDLPAILELVAKRARALVGARSLVIELEAGADLMTAAGAGSLPEGIVGRRLPLAGTVAAVALDTRRTQRLDDADNRARFQEHGLGSLGLHAESGLVVPLVFRDTAHGVIVAIDPEDGANGFSAQHERLLVAFAVSAATAVATARMVSTERRAQRVAAAEEERRRWARELHDETLQGMAALRLGLASARRTGDSAAVELAAAVAIEQLDSDIAGLRSLITELRPAALDDLGTEAAIEALAARARASGLEVDLDLDLDFERGRRRSRLTPDLEIALYRIVQEALTNARIHGEAVRVRVRVGEAGDRLTLSIADDGVGFDPASRNGGLGLLGMHERVELAGGELTIESELGGGTTVTAELPVRRRPDPAPPG